MYAEMLEEYLHIPNARVNPKLKPVFLILLLITKSLQSLSLSLSSRAVVDQHTRPQVRARLHGLETPPRVR